MRRDIHSTRRRGTAPPARCLDDESYLDAVEGFYEHARRTLGPAVARQADAVTAARLGDGDGAREIGRLRELLDPLPAVAIRNRFHRTTQEMMWRRIRATFDGEREALEAALEAAARGSQGLELDPAFVLPGYYASAEFHIQPGSYHTDPLAGFWYHYGSKIVFLGQNDHDEVHATAVRLAPAPHVGAVERVLDLGCSIGQSTLALKRRFPAATVEGIDVAAPMLRYAHWRAVSGGCAVIFRQRCAEATRFGSGEFDVVYAFLLFHETPREAATAVIAEAYRVLRPGGTFVIVDNAAGDATMTPFRRYTSDFSRRFNGEAHAFDFDTGDFLGQLRASPFGNAEELVFAADVQIPFRMWVLRR